MPELPEIETIRQNLAKTIIGRRIISTNCFLNRLRYEIPQELLLNCQNSVINSVSRKSKYLIITLSNAYSIIIHLGMSGRVLVKDISCLRNKHDHVKLYLDNNKKLILNDPRKFGMLDVTPTTDIENYKFFVKLGVEPLTEAFDQSYLAKICKRRLKPIKTLLMDASLIVGVGNIYASESLFEAKISPLRRAETLTANEAGKLVCAVKQVLTKAIGLGGSSLRDYVNAEGEKGNFQSVFNVYGRENLPCIICSSKIIKTVQTGRSSFFCENCQD